MIQRIQSLWLLVAALSVCLLCFFPVATFSPDPQYANANAVVFGFYAYGLDYVPAFSERLDGLYTPLLKYTVIVVLLVCAVTPFVAIFIYRNRPRQMQLSRLTMLLNVALTVAFFLLSDFFAKEKFAIADYGIGIYVPIVALISLLLAVRSIKKDDKLVRSADRIR
jgi:4-amino-4-deoxy-L-arabinose transferase-like glycosyltransferase